MSIEPLDPASIDLDRWREVADPPADAAVAEYFAAVEASAPGQLFGHLVRHTRLPAEEQVPAVRTFLETAAMPPDWVDERAVARGQEFFNRLVAHHFSALYLSSLPNSYAAAKGVQVLRLTSRLQTDTERRLNETAQFMMDIAAPGAMDPGGAGVDRILHVRLMHAAVRWLIAHDPSVERVESMPPPAEEGSTLVWSASWGLPANQEDLVGTWLTFTVAVYDAFDVSGVEYDSSDVDDHLHLWRLVGHYLGASPELVPLDRAAASELRDRIWHRQQAPSGAGRAMTAALVAQSHQHMPRLAWPVMPTAFRHFLGDHVADMIGLAPANWTRHLFPVMSALTRILTRGKATNRFHARVSAFVGRHLMNGILDEMRHGDRPAFAIPTHLADAGGR
ncbi:MAG: oxygenase MpaB family protein [Ilumatobacter sp.]|uniref:oxygenase MpaB family protein n=1 Tax=Ilumatobacter sp. TaxID=1967498 RepID=UPI00260F73BC|nr:oxygenase MpaB family protein [Ilumatobacter sp.]MDJ0770980.1 oxygenase MpaB family protein [Ilumatobacter sp.]